MRTLLILAAGLAAAAAGAAEPGGNAVPAELFAARRLDWLPLLRMPAVYPVRFPVLSSATSVRAMAWSSGKLWLSAQTVDQPAPREEVGRLWSYDPAADRIDQIGGTIQDNWVTAIAADGSRIWAAMDGGLVAFDPKAGRFEVYGSWRGVPAATMTGAGFVGDTLVGLAWSGSEFSLRPGATNFVESAQPPVTAAGDSGGWRRFAVSGLWSLAVADEAVAARRAASDRWTTAGPEFFRGSPRGGAARLTCAEGDGDGGFWVGGDDGLHHYNPETDAVENWFAARTVKIAGGLSAPSSPWFKPTAEGRRMARERMALEVRERMRNRARQARLPEAEQATSSPLWPSSRLPGGVTAILRDHDSLWIAASDGLNTNRSRILLRHPLSRRWVGWIPMPRTVRCLAANERYLFVGMDSTGDPRDAPIAALEKISLIGVPPARWTPDAIPAEEVERRLAALPARERAVYYFFGGRPQKVVDLLAPGGVASPGTDAEALFLLAFAHDAAGLNDPAALVRWIRELRERSPDHVLTELALSALPQAEPPPAAEAEPVQDSADAVLGRRDLDGDGAINPAEFKLWRGDQADFRAADRNGDGLLDRAEIEALIRRP